ncbi:19962_t:CDS:2, partial [Racocetra persica]
MLRSLTTKVTAQIRYNTSLSVKKSVGSKVFKIQRSFVSTYNAHVAGLTNEQNELREMVYNFCQKELAPRAAVIDKENSFPM